MIKTPPSIISRIMFPCSCLTKRLDRAQRLPAPRVIIGAGHATHLTMLAAGRAHKAKTVALMRPSLPLSWFDFCLIPEHDDPPARDNVIITRGAVNALQPGQPGNRRDQRRGLILVGGPSRHYDFDVDSLMADIRQVLSRTPRRHWALCNSPRTPVALVDAVNELKAQNVEVVAWDQCEAGWLTAELPRAGEVWVTEDSVAMIYEALTAGCRVGLLPQARNGASRLHRGIDRLLREGHVSAFSDWLKGGELAAPDNPPDEANRCAQLLINKGLLV